MKGSLITVIVLVVLVVGYWLVSPLFIDKKVSEELPIEVKNIETETVFKGKFTGFDKIHYGSGDVSVLKTGDGYILRFEDNFNVANGPDLYVGLGKDGEYKSETQIARLKGNIGSQNYILPDEINLEDYNEIWIWCRAFSVGFAKARLESMQ